METGQLNGTLQTLSLIAVLGTALCAAVFWGSGLGVAAIVATACALYLTQLGVREWRLGRLTRAAVQPEGRVPLLLEALARRADGAEHVARVLDEEAERMEELAGLRDVAPVREALSRRLDRTQDLLTEATEWVAEEEGREAASPLPAIEALRDARRRAAARHAANREVSPL